ncbi:MAG: Rne/Rng family ribonuclease [Cyanobacteria bacterium P01_C01_bin.73]
MPKQIVIAEQHRIAAVFSEDQIQELIVATGSHQVGDVYVGTVENVIPGIDAAFVNIGDSERNGFMHVTDLGPLKLKRSAASITELLAPQQKVLVQIMKEPTGNKGPRLTGNVTLPGRYLVLMPYGRGVNLSRRIESDKERHRLRALAILVKPAGMGLLVRTEAEGMPEEAIIEDLEALQKQWEVVQQEAMSTRPPALLNRDDDFIQRVLRDVYSADVNRIVTDSHTGLKRVKQHLSGWSSGKAPQGVLTDHHRDRTPILEFFRVNAAIREALKPRVDLPSGGYIIIEPTEALTVIDVNSGSFTRSATARETVLWTNYEAAAEIARQLRLRNVAGVIVVDFIDMDSRRDQMQVLEHFSKALSVDKARPQISQLSELGLVELTRKRQGQNIYELFGRPCPTCNALGHVVHLPGESRMPDQTAADAGFYPSTAGTVMPTLKDSRSAPEALAPDEDLQNLDLVNHPNYQERNSSRGNRRHRRRKNGADGTSRNAPRIESGRESNAPEAESSDRRDSIPAKAGGNGSTSGRANGKGRGGSRDERKPQTPPEEISVTMTPAEQRVYALMGISPLVLANQTIKNPKNAMVSVLLPGQEPPTAQAEAPSQPQATDSASSKKSNRQPKADIVSKKKRAAPKAALESAPENSPENSQDSNSLIVASQNAGSPEEADENGAAASGRRRRRRRSSAASTEAAAP